ncbi:hypothetical protein HDE_03677 [Halotydeus destructor]|nr:hypothetical protein HDE_03677 [Halotydeus destructor]
MSSVRKVNFQPYEEEAPMEHTHVEPKKKGNFIMLRAVERQRKLLKIIMRLAAINGYNDTENIKLSDGSYMSDSDIVSLLMHVLSPGKLVNGLKEFVDLLHTAGVTPDLIVNENVKAMLQKLHRVQPVRREAQPIVTQQIETPMEDVQSRAPKRRHEEVIEERTEPPIKRPALKAKFRRTGPDTFSYEAPMNAAKSIDWDDDDSDLDE